MEDKLKKELENVDWDNPQDSFEAIAKTLMGEYVIRKRAHRYAIVEIEFYLFSESHRDYITYPRNVNAGRWYFHQSGVDLTFDSTSSKRFGGILIRGLYKLDSGDDEKEHYIFGPLKCVNELWNHFNAFEGSDADYPKLEHNTTDILKINGFPIKLKKCNRYINIPYDKIEGQKMRKWAERIGVDTPSADEIRKYYNDYIKARQYRFFNLRDWENDLSQIPSASRPKNVTDC